MRSLNQADIGDSELVAVLTAFVQFVAGFPDFVSAILFGSQARTEHHSDSDADVAVLLAGSAGEFVKTKFALNDLAYAVLLNTRIRIQPLPAWQAEWDNPDAHSNPPLLRNIAKDGIYLDSLISGKPTQN